MPGGATQQVQRCIRARIPTVRRERCAEKWSPDSGPILEAAMSNRTSPGLNGSNWFSGVLMQRSSPEEAKATRMSCRNATHELDSEPAKYP